MPSVPTGAGSSRARGGTLKLWETASGREVRTLVHTPSPYVKVFAVAFSPDGRWLGSGIEKVPVQRPWEVDIQGIEGKLDHPDGIRAMAFSRDDRWFASGGEEKMVKLWRRVEK